jgi:predicted dehydrogenase
VVTARVGVVGAGWWSTRVHLPSLAGYERAAIVGIADHEHERARLAADRFGGAAYTDLAPVLEAAVDVVVIATPHDTHYSLARQALEAGVDVLVEKPMVIEPLDGIELVDLARRVGRRLHVGYPYPHAIHAKVAREAVIGGALGEIQLVASMFATPAGLLYHDAPRFDPPEDALVGPDPATYRDQRTGGQARGQMTHSISLMLFVTGLAPSSVTAYTSTTGLDVDMVDVGAFTTSEGAIGTVATTGAVPLGVRPIERLEVYGSKGHLQYDMSGGNLGIDTGEGLRTSPPVQDLDRYPEHVPARHLVDCFLDGSPPLVDGELGASTAAFIDALLRSARDGARCDLTNHTEPSRR